MTPQPQPADQHQAPLPPPLPAARPHQEPPAQQRGPPVPQRGRAAQLALQARLARLARLAQPALRNQPVQLVQLALPAAQVQLAAQAQVAGRPKKISQIYSQKKGSSCSLFLLLIESEKMLNFCKQTRKDLLVAWHLLLRYFFPLPTVYWPASRFYQFFLCLPLYVLTNHLSRARTLADL